MSKLTFTASSLPVSKKLHKLLSEQFTAHLLSNEAVTTSRYLVFNFRDKTYSADEGGFHPVEMAICQTSTGEWSIEYITDFAYMGNYYPELERNLDFDFRVGQFFVAYRGWLQKWTPLVGHISSFLKWLTQLMLRIFAYRSRPHQE